MTPDNIYSRPIPSEVIDHIRATAGADDGSIGDDGEGRSKWAHFTPGFVDTKAASLDLESVLQTLSDRRRTYQEGTISQRSATIELAPELPFTIWFLGDVHWGSVYTDHERFMADVQTLEDTPNMYTVLLHNMVDNAIPAKFPDNMLSNSITPAEQFPSMQKILKRLDDRGKILGAIEADCHEGWTWAKVGVSAANLLYGWEGRSFPVLLNGGLLYLKLPDIEYTLGLWHKQGPFNSNFNKSHSLQQMQRMYHRGQADVEAGGHNHTAEVMMTWYGNIEDENQAPVCYVRCGTYKGIGGIPDRFGVDRRGISGEPPGGSVLFFPKHKEMDTSLTLETAVKKHMDMYVSEYLREMGLYEPLVANIMKKD